MADDGNVSELTGHQNLAFQHADYDDGKKKTGKPSSSLAGTGQVVIEMTPGDDKKKKKVKEPETETETEPSIAWFQVFRFSSVFDRFLLFFGTLGALCHGCIMPLIVWVLGNTIDDFVNPMFSGCGNMSYLINDTQLALSNMTADDMVSSEINKAKKAIHDMAVYFAIIGGCSIVVSFVQSYCWNIAAENQMAVIRKLYFRSLLHQDISWYDSQDAGTLTTKFAEDMKQLQNGMGDKLALFVQNLGAFLGCCVVGLVTGWQLCLVTLSLMPVSIIATFYSYQVAFQRYNAEAAAYEQAGAIAQQVLQSIRTVFAFGRQNEEITRYTSHLSKVYSVAIKSGLITGLITGGTYFVLIAMYTLGFSYGVSLVNDPDSGYKVGRVLTVVFAVLEGTFAFGQSVGAVQAFGGSRSSAGRIYQIIDSRPKIDAYAVTGKKCDKASFRGKVTLEQVNFAYPSRADVPILKGVSLSIEPGTTVALVGTSGCGKSTIIQLIQRLYDADSGSIQVDGVDIKEYNVASLRSMIGSVNQEPVLFNTTISENIRYGLPGEYVALADVEKAARLSNAHDFISKLPKGYDTLVGEQGAQMSGGQKQRIAIARALVRNPRILLLDEATSALDTESEAIVQDALDKAREGRTTIAVAHRLSTIMNADKIIVMDKGKVCEVGTHSELMALQGGIYRQLVAAQQGEGAGDEIEATTAQERRAALVNKTRRLSASGNKEREETAPKKTELTEREQKKQTAEIVKKNFSLLRLWKMAAPETHFFILGSFGAVLCGVMWPAYAIVLTRILTAFSLCTADDRFRRGLMFSLIILALGFAAFIGYTLMFWMYAYGGEKIVLRVRKLAFTAMLKQDIAWYDKEENSPGALTARLSTQASALRDATGGQIGQVVQIVSGLFAALIIAFIHEWRITLIMLCFAPVQIISVIATMKMYDDNVAQDRFVEEASKALAQSTTNIRTVASLGLQMMFIDIFNKPIEMRQKRQICKNLILAVCFSMVESTYACSYSAGFAASSVFIFDWGVSTFEGMFTAYIAIMFCSFFIGMANALAPDQAKAKLGVAEIFKLLDEVPTIRWDDHSGTAIKPTSFEGNAQLVHVEFHYPTRSESKVLRGLTVQIEPGQTVALVGASGCGKSTVIQLLERFYDPVSGEVKLDNNSLPTLHLQWARGKMSLVSQEPILFDRTIAENIGYGCDGVPTEQVTQNEIENAAKMANIHDFIAGLPDGYRTKVGERGVQLSGGQKQRVAIARALIRKPKLLLLDEATSALDSENEKIVQAALDQARTGRTAVVIAHRLSTIENADVIIVFEHGTVKEFGKHADLLAMKGIYYGLWSAQYLASS